jgi:hypothetical protein
MTSDIELHPDFTPAPTTLFQSPDPALIVAQATRVADVIAPLIRDRQLAKRIGASEHVYLEGWTLAGTMLGVFPITVASGALFDADGRVYGYQATVEARTMAGAVVGRADAECTRDENDKWRNAPSFQLRSMAQTRASSKALRMPLGFVMKLAGYDTTPAEEMEAAAARGETVTGGKGVRPGWRDMAEQQRAHADLGELIDAHDLRKWVVEWCDSKGYVRPLAKGQFTQLKRAIDAEVQARATKTSGSAAHSPPSPTEPDDQSPEPNPAPTAVAGSGGPRPSPSTSPEGEGPKAGRGRQGGHRSGEGVRSAADPPPAGPDAEQTEQAAFEQAQAGDDAGRFAR